jgi:hypothetical protein
MALQGFEISIAAHEPDFNLWESLNQGQGMR